LNALNDLLNIRAHRYDIDIVLVFVDVIAEDLLALLIDIIEIVQDDELLFARYAAMRLTKGLHFIAIVLDPLFFEIIDKQNVVLGKRGGLGQIVILSYDGM